MASALKSQPVKSKNLVRRVSGESTSYPSMVGHQLEDVHENNEGKYFLIILPRHLSSNRISFTTQMQTQPLKLNKRRLLMELGNK